MIRFRTFLFAAVPTMLLAVPTNALAGSIEFVELKDGTERQLTLSSAFRTTFFFPEQVVHFAIGNKKDYELDIDPQWKRFDIQPKPRAAATNANFETGTARLSFTIGLGPTAPDDAVPCVTRAVIVLPPGTKLEEPPPNDLCAEDLSTETMALLFGKLSEQEILDPVTAYFRSAAHQLEFRTGSRSVGDLGMWFAFEVRNVGNTPYPTTGLAVGDGASNTDHLIASMLATHTGKLPPLLAPGESVRGAILASHPAQLRKGFVVQLLSSPGVVQAAFRWSDKPPPPPPPPPPSVGKLGIGVQFIGGAARLEDDNGVDDWTSLRGVGARMTYGAHKYVSLQGDAAVFYTGDATLGLQTAQGTGGRLGAYVMAQSGTNIVPFLRAGAGVLAFRQKNDGTPDTNADLFASLGLGVEAWIGDRWSAGLSTSFFTGPLRTAEAELHVSYAWEP